MRMTARGSRPGRPWAVDRVAGAGGRPGHFGPDVIRAMEQVIVGQRYMLERLLVGLLANGHVLIEGFPASPRPSR